MELNQTIRETMHASGADLVGFADVTGLAPEGYTRAVVVAIALPVSVIEEIPIGPTQEYLDAYDAINRQLDTMAETVAQMLMEAGYRSMPLIRANVPWDREKNGNRISL